MKNDLKLMTILADSLAMVRPNDEIFEKDLYSYKIQKRFYDRLYVLNRATRKNTTTMECSEKGLYNHIDGAGSSFFVIHLGICDSAPRLFTKGEKLFLDLLMQIPVLRIFSNAFINSRSNNRAKYTEKKQITETPIGDYKKNIKFIIERIKEKNPIEHIFIINTAFPGPAMTKRSYGIEDNIMRFNALLGEVAEEYGKDLVSLVDVFSYTRENPNYIISSCGHHVTVEVNDFITENISLRLSSFL